MRWQAFVLLLIGITLFASALGVGASIRAQPRSYREAVGRVLEARDVRYRTVIVTDGCAPSYQQCRTYHGQVQLVTKTATLRGQIVCRRRWFDCTLSIPEEGLERVALPNIVDPQTWSVARLWAPIQEWLGKVTRYPLKPPSLPIFGIVPLELVSALRHIKFSTKAQ